MLLISEKKDIKIQTLLSSKKFVKIIHFKFYVALYLFEYVISKIHVLGQSKKNMSITSQSETFVGF